MYVYLDAFDYDELVPILTSILGEDTPLTTENIAKVFSDAIERTSRYKGYLDPLTVDTAVEHLASWLYNTRSLEHMSIITTEEFIANLCDTLYVMDAEIEPGYARLYQILDVYFQNPKRAKTKDGVFIDPTFEEMNELFTNAYQILAKYEAWCETPDEEALRKMLYTSLRGDEAWDVEFTVVDTPSTKISCGNSLITFPLILAKVTCYET